MDVLRSPTARKVTLLRIAVDCPWCLQAAVRALRADPHVRTVEAHRAALEVVTASTLDEVLATIASIGRTIEVSPSGEAVMAPARAPVATSCERHSTPVVSHVSIHAGVSDPDEGGDAPCWAHLVEAEQEPDRFDDTTLARLVHDLGDAVVVCDRDGTIGLWNDAAARLFGWTAEEAIGASLDLFIPERLQHRHWVAYHRAMATGHTEYVGRLLEVPAVHRSGRTISIAFTVTLVRDREGAVTGVAAVIRDDTERRQESERLRRTASPGAG